MSKKAAAKTKDEITYDLRDVVLAKIRGYPPWPALVADPENVPKEVARERPAGKKQTFYCVRFFPAGDHAWVPPKDLSKLKKHEIEAYIAEPHKKNGDLLTGYRIALDPEPWERQMEDKRVEAEEAEADAEVDELDGEEEPADDEKPAKTKKRKRESEAGAKAKPKVKKEKEKDKDAGEVTTRKKKPAAEKADKPAKPRKNGAKSKTMVESEDEGERADDAGPSKKASPPPAKKVKRDKDEEVDPEMENDPEANKVKDMRHRLQRAFLGKTLPKDELKDVPSLDSLFNQVEEFDMTIKYLQHSKIGKVMRHIAALEDERVPRDEEFKFKDRAQALVNKWHTKINKVNGSAEPKPMDVEKLSGAADGSAVPPSAATEESSKKDADGEADAAAEDDSPAVGDLTIGESMLGDVTMSEIAA
ncbi:hypothetical protein M0805_000753 [Coniferiporia weirii]|nr:hypothetical protein M0805_000753 [Coniferiporia weirii]